MKRVIFSVIFICTGAFLGSKITTAPQGTTLHIDSVFAIAQQDELATAYSRLRNAAFQGVSELKVQSVPLGAHVVCTADLPSVAMNGTHVLTRHGNLLPKNIFREDIFCALPHMVIKDIAQFEANKDGIIAFAQKLTPQVTAWYEVTWMRPSVVTWIDRQCPGLTLLTRADQFVSQEQSQLAQKIYMKLGESEPTRERNGLIPANFATMVKTGQKMMVIDLRFERHQIVKIGSGGSDGSFIR
jgi:hypothetical protein